MQRMDRSGNLMFATRMQGELPKPFEFVGIFTMDRFVNCRPEIFALQLASRIGGQVYWNARDVE